MYIYLLEVWKNLPYCQIRCYKNNIYIKTNTIQTLPIAAINLLVNVRSECASGMYSKLTKVHVIQIATTQIFRLTKSNT